MSNELTNRNNFTASGFLLKASQQIWFVVATLSLVQLYAQQLNKIKYFESPN